MGVDEVVCAVPQKDVKEIGEALPYFNGLIGWSGDENDVLGRYVFAAEWASADIIMRITADCPLICPEICGAVLALRNRANAAYASNIEPRTFPRGLDCEVFTRAALDVADRYSAPVSREHVTPFMRGACIDRTNLTAPWPMEGRLCLDTEDDYKVIKAYFNGRD